MDPAEIRFIREVIIKERGVEIFREIRQSPMLQRPYFKVTVPSHMAVGNLEMNSQRYKSGSKRK
jgi:hypothetical protein